MTRCIKQVSDGGRFVNLHQCNNTATVERDGKPYCGVHDPKPDLSGEVLWVVLKDYQSAYKPKLWPLKVAKRTAKTIMFPNGNNALGARRLSVDCIDADQPPSDFYRRARVCTTREKAARAYMVQCSNAAVAAKQALDNAVDASRAAVALLDEVTP